MQPLGGRRVGPSNRVAADQRAGRSSARTRAIVDRGGAVRRARASRRSSVAARTAAWPAAVESSPSARKVSATLPSSRRRRCPHCRTTMPSTLLLLLLASPPPPSAGGISAALLIRRRRPLIVGRPEITLSSPSSAPPPPPSALSSAPPGQKRCRLPCPHPPPPVPPHCRTTRDRASSPSSCLASAAIICCPSHRRRPQSQKLASRLPSSAAAGAPSLSDDQRSRFFSFFLASPLLRLRPSDAARRSTPPLLVDASPVTAAAVAPHRRYRPTARALAAPPCPFSSFQTTPLDAHAPCEILSAFFASRLRSRFSNRQGLRSPRPSCRCASHGRAVPSPTPTPSCSFYRRTRRADLLSLDGLLSPSPIRSRLLVVSVIVAVPNTALMLPSIHSSRAGRRRAPSGTSAGRFARGPACARVTASKRVSPSCSISSRAGPASGRFSSSSHTSRFPLLLLLVSSAERQRAHHARHRSGSSTPEAQIDDPTTKRPGT